jgi:hypothetical protein
VRLHYSHAAGEKDSWCGDKSQETALEVAAVKMLEDFHWF